MSEPIAITTAFKCQICAGAMQFSQVITKLPDKDVVVSQLSHYHDESRIHNVASLMGDLTIRQLAKVMPRPIYIRVECPDDCDCHDRYED